MKLTTRMIPIACNSDVMNSEIAASTVTAWFCDELRLDADRQICGDLCHSALEAPAERENIAAVAHGDGQADGGLPIDSKLGLRGSE